MFYIVVEIIGDKMKNLIENAFIVIDNKLYMTEEAVADFLDTSIEILINHTKKLIDIDPDFNIYRKDEKFYYPSVYTVDKINTSINSNMSTDDFDELYKTFKRKNRELISNQNTFSSEAFGCFFSIITIFIVIYIIFSCIQVLNEKYDIHLQKIEQEEREEKIKKENERKKELVKNLSILWCNKIEDFRKKFENKWIVSFHTLKSVDDAQKLYNEVVDYNKNLNERDAYRIPNEVDEDVKNKMLLTKQEFSDCLKNRMIMLEYFIDYTIKYQDTGVQDFGILQEGKPYYDTSKVNMENTRKYLYEIYTMVNN